MRGSPVYQITKLWQESGINCIGTSRHEAKAQARHDCQMSGIQATPHHIGLKTGIHSYGTADAYRDVWISIVRHARTHDGIRDVEKLSGEHVAFFLHQKIAERVSFATYQQYTAAAQKLAVALQLYSNSHTTGRTYDFNAAIKSTAEMARDTLTRFSGSRAYRNPSAVIQAIGNPDHRLAGQLQYSSGARISEIALIRHNQLLGMKLDPVTGKECGCILAQGKGGRIAHHLIDLDSYHKVMEIIRTRGEYRIDKDDYRDSIKKACTAVEERYTGSHGFRWNRAAERVTESMRHGMNYDQALAITALALSHSRTSITDHYRG
jgi:hypothetical protein